MCARSPRSALIGCLVDEGALSLSQTLEDIFNGSMGVAEWAQVENREMKRRIKLDELLTMESGLVDPVDGRAQGSLVEVLNHGVYRPGIYPFTYLSSTHILAYIVREAAGESPQAYAQSDRCPIWSSLGLSATADVSWDVNDEGVATSAFGLRLTVAAMLKLGALYLQGGLSAPSTRLLSQSWASASTQSQTQYSPWGTAGVCDTLNGYGYQWWVQRAAAGSDYYCAIGYMGQFVCVYPSLDAVLAVVARDYSYADPCRLVRMVSELSLPAVDGDCSPGPPPPPPLPLPSGTPLSSPPPSTTPATTAPQPQVPQPPAPRLPLPPPSATLSSSPDSSTVAAVAGGVAGGVVVLLLAASAVFVLHRYNRREEEEGRLPARFAATARSSFVI